MSRYFPRIGATALAIWLALLLAVAHSRYYIAYSFAAAAIVWMRTRPPARRYLYVAAITAILWIIRLTAGQTGPSSADSLPEQIFYVTAGFAGAGSLIMFAMFGLAEGGTSDAIDFVAAFSISSFGLIADRWFRYMTDHPLASLDRTLFAVDHLFGFQASFAAGQAFARWPPLAFLCGAAYRMVPLTIAFVYVNLPARTAQLKFAAAIASSSALGYAAYRLCPAAGPAYAFTTMFPMSVPAIASGWVHPVEMNSSLLNAFPSLHATWALLTLWWSRMTGRWARVAVACLVLLTLLATLGLGEHYLIDLAVAAPFAVLFETICSMAPLRWKQQLVTGVVSGGTFLAWVIAVRSGRVLAMDPLTARTAAAATVSLPLVLRSFRR